jgi:hypothetical protein
VKERKVLENKETEGPSLSSAVIIERRGLDPWTLYLYAMKSPATKEKYLMRLGKFLDFLNLQGNGKLEDKATIFAEKGRDIIFGPSIASSSLYNYSRNVLIVKK